MTFLLYIGAVVFAAIVVTAAAVTQRVKVWNFRTSTVLLTGGSVGIGLETAKELVKREVKHLVIGARREAVLQAAVADLQALKESCKSPTLIFYVVLDVSDEASVKKAVVETERLCGGSKVDLLICNAGFAHPARFLDSTMKDARSMMDINYFGCLNLMWAVMPDMVARRKGRVVLTSSLAARAPIAGYTLYAATKAGIRAFAHCVDMENSCLGVRVQVVSPPDVETPGFEHENEVKSPECAAISAFGGSKPFKAEDMGKAIVAGIENYKFDITLGSDGWLVSHCSAGIEPATSTLELLFEIVAGGPLRLGLAVFSKIHYGIVKKVRLNEKKK